MNAAVAVNPIANVDLEHICSYWATLAAPEVIGPVPELAGLPHVHPANADEAPLPHGKVRSLAAATEIRTLLCLTCA